ncbi:hypothetical protein U8607_21945 [Methylobacterium durans]|uniref:hypothetical protein n=1 Tax=Methylobacterium durans TaxID=2202825 RepID=UPI002AFDCE58|nr:hypothetical protein [Methylobacterium durans]MEA1834761.1 hypothetical protein [Methylobacterium durans]
MQSKSGDGSAELLARAANGPEGILVGTWVKMPATGVRFLDQDAADILLGDVRLADTALSLEATARRIHPEDQAIYLAAFERAEREGGLCVIEYRVEMPDGRRWLLDHGRLYPASKDMPALGHGVLIDITQQKLDGAERDPWGASPLDRAARHAISARRAIDADGSASLRHLVDMLLWELGRVLARRLEAAHARAPN